MGRVPCAVVVFLVVAIAVNVKGGVKGSPCSFAAAEDTEKAACPRRRPSFQARQIQIASDTHPDLITINAICLCSLNFLSVEHRLFPRRGSGEREHLVLCVLWQPLSGHPRVCSEVDPDLSSPISPEKIPPRALILNPALRSPDSVTNKKECVFPQREDEAECKKDHARHYVGVWPSANHSQPSAPRASRKRTCKGHPPPNYSQTSLPSARRSSRSSE